MILKHHNNQTNNIDYLLMILNCIFVSKYTSNRVTGFIFIIDELCELGIPISPIIKVKQVIINPTEWEGDGGPINLGPLLFWLLLS